MKLENSVHGNISRNNTFPSVMKYHTKLEVLHSWNILFCFGFSQQSIRTHTVF